jgi:hypothetical protein
MTWRWKSRPWLGIDTKLVGQDFHFKELNLMLSFHITKILFFSQIVLPYRTSLEKKNVNIYFAQSLNLKDWKARLFIDKICMFQNSKIFSISF